MGEGAGAEVFIGHENVGGGALRQIDMSPESIIHSETALFECLEDQHYQILP